MSDLISKQMAIDSLTEIIMNLKNVYGDMGSAVNGARECIKSLPSAKPDNQVHLCIFCKYSYPECPAEMSDIIFGNGIGHDNVCACAKFEIKPEREAKVYKKQAPDRLYQFYCGGCGKMIDCSFYENYKSIKSYCGYCGAKLDWSNHE